MGEAAAAGGRWAGRTLADGELEAGGVEDVHLSDEDVRAVPGLVAHNELYDLDQERHNRLHDASC